MKITEEELYDLTKGVKTWDELKNTFIKLGLITPKEIEMDENFSKLDKIIFQKRERGEITELEYNRMNIELEHENTRACSKLYDEENGVNTDDKCEIDEWLEELDKIIAARNTNKITLTEYWKLCFELDKKYGFAYDDDATIYLGYEDNSETESQIYEIDNFAGQIAVNF